jgi:hypothetical protein
MALRAMLTLWRDFCSSDAIGNDIRGEKKNFLPYFSGIDLKNIEDNNQNQIDMGRTYAKCT